MADKHQVDHRNMLLGCSLIALIVLIGLMALSVFVFRQERQAVRYPGAAQISSHANYKSLPREFRWDDAYRTADPFPAVYNWYSNGFNLGPESRANGSCILLEGLTGQLTLERYMGVMLCDTPKGRMIFVSRSVSLR